MRRERGWAGHYKGGRSAARGRVSLGLRGLQLEVSKLNTHIRGESQAPCKDLAFCKKCLIKGSARGGLYLSQSLLHRSAAHFTLRTQDVSILNASCCCLLGTSLHELYERMPAEERKGGWKQGRVCHSCTGENVRYIRLSTWKLKGCPPVWLLVRDGGCFSLVGEVGPAAPCTSTSAQAVPHMSVFLQVAACFLGMANPCLCRLWKL